MERFNKPHSSSNPGHFHKHIACIFNKTPEKASHCPNSIMGNSISQKALPQNSTGKVILWDGSVREFGAEAQVTVAELMLEHPQQAVVEFRSAVTGKRPAALPADTRLEPRKVYLMLPMRRGGKASALSAEEVRRAVLAANAALRSRALAARFVPLFARICRPAAAPVPVAAKKNETASVCEEEQTSYVSLESLVGERPEYLSRQFSGKRGNWKPSLDTIEEKVKADQKKVSHWLF